MIILTLLASLLLTYLAWAVFYQLLYAISGHFFKKEKGAQDNLTRRFAVFIPSYKEDSVILETARQALTQHYPANKYDVVVIADKLQPLTVQKLKSLPIKVVEVQFEKSTKSKSLNAAIAQIGGGYDAAVVLDADNHMQADFLQNMNATLAKGFHAVQGCRAAKNSHNAMSMLDGVSEAVNNHILCNGHRAIGFSARLAGSGMAFEYQLFTKVMATVDALGGFDKEMELKITQLGETIAYSPEAVVFDEKVDNTGTFARQRGRWLAAQYRYGRRFAPAALNAVLMEGNFDFFNKTLQMALPPRLILPGVLTIGTALSLMAGFPMFALIWAVLLVANLTSFALSIPRHYWQPEFLLALLQIPLAFGSTIKALMLMPLAGKEFLHTPHRSLAVPASKN